jgi:hypothetical protein
MKRTYIKKRCIESDSESVSSDSSYDQLKDEIDETKEELDNLFHDQQKTKKQKVDSDEKQKLSFDEHKKKYDRISHEILERTISLANILKLDLSMDDNIWFVEYLKILKNSTYGTEDYYRINKMIYDKYLTLKNSDQSKFNKIKNDSGTEDCIVTKILN